MADNITTRSHEARAHEIPKYLGVFRDPRRRHDPDLFRRARSIWTGSFPGANTLVALLIAFTKMTCVMLFFMHVYWSPKLIWLAAVASFFWLAIMFAYTMQDYLTRGPGVFTAVRTQNSEHIDAAARGKIPLVAASFLD